MAKKAPMTSAEPVASPGPKPAFKLPKTLGACADRLYELKALKAKANDAVGVLEAEEKAIKEHVVQTLPKSEASGISGKVANVRVVSKNVPQVKDWAALHQFIKKKNAFELLQKRVSDTAVKERWDAGQQVPGVEAFNAVTVSVTKI